MSTRINIEHLVLDGIELSRRERDALGPAIARHLRQLTGEPGAGRAALRPQEPGSAVERIAREVAAAVRLATAAHLATAAARPVAGQGKRPASPPAHGGSR